MKPFAFVPTMCQDIFEINLYPIQQCGIEGQDRGDEVMRTYCGGEDDKITHVSDHPSKDYQVFQSIFFIKQPHDGC